MFSSQDPCPHTKTQHRVWWMDDYDQDIPVPKERILDNHVDAAHLVLALAGNPEVQWCRAFRADNEVYQCVVYEREDPEAPQPAQSRTAELEALLEHQAEQMARARERLDHALRMVGVMILANLLVLVAALVVFFS